MSPMSHIEDKGLTLGFPDSKSSPHFSVPSEKDALFIFMTVVHHLH